MSPKFGGDPTVGTPARVKTLIGKFKSLPTLTVHNKGREVPRGWPFGLGSMNLRIGGVEAATSTRESNYFHGPSSGFSSFSSSNLDTESTASFFQDNSVSLGRLIGIRSRDNGTLYFPRHEFIPEQRPRRSEVSSNSHQTEATQGVCVPNLLNILVKISRSKSQSRQ